MTWSTSTVLGQTFCIFYKVIILLHAIIRLIIKMRETTADKKLLCV